MCASSYCVLHHIPERDVGNFDGMESESLNSYCDSNDFTGNVELTSNFPSPAVLFGNVQWNIWDDVIATARFCHCLAHWQFERFFFSDLDIFTTHKQQWLSMVNYNTAFFVNVKIFVLMKLNCFGWILFYFEINSMHDVWRTCTTNRVYMRVSGPSKYATKLKEIIKFTPHSAGYWWFD